MISYPFPPNLSAGAVRTERFARYLAEFDWNVDVITIGRRANVFHDEEGLAKLPESVSVNFTKIWDPWLWLYRHQPESRLLGIIRSGLMRLASFPDHMIFWVPTAVRKGVEKCRSGRIHAIYTTSPPHSTHLAGLFISKKSNLPWIADFRDPWTLNSYEKNRSSNAIRAAERRLETAVLKNAHKILANTETNRRNLLKEFEFLSGEKVKLIPNGWEEFHEADLDHGSNLFRERVNRKFSIVHAGTFYPKFKPYSLLHAVAEWKSKGCPDLKNKLKITLLGATDETTAQIVQNLELYDIVDLKPWVGLDEARFLMQNADLLWASLGLGRESASFIPSKLFEYIAARRPIIGFFPEGEAANLIRNTGTGIVISKDEPADVIAVIEKMMLANRRIRPDWYRPQEKVLAVHHIRNTTERLFNILSEITRSDER